jgi:hypothetical protein
MWWITQLELYGFASGAEVVQQVLCSGYELTDLRLCALGLVDVVLVQWCVSCSREAAVNQIQAYVWW